jgi:CSLREA domain-containing protein
MATRRTSRQTARRRRWHAQSQPARSTSASSHYARKLRYEPLEDRRVLALVTVTTLADTVDFNDGVASLREAIFGTNLVGGADTIDFAPALTASGPATILLTQGELVIADNLTITGPSSGLLTIDASGNDPTPTAEDGRGSRIFSIDDGTDGQIDVSIAGLRLTGGDITGRGGAVHSVESVVLSHLTIESNAASDAGGGAYAFVDGLGSIDILSSLIQNNVSKRGGGGGINIRLRDGANVHFVDSVVNNNRSFGTTASGGGVHIQHIGGGNISSSGNRFTENLTNGTVAEGGGAYAIHSGSGFIDVKDNIFGNNASDGQGGGFYASHSGSGLVNVIDNDFENNMTDGTLGQGGGLFVRRRG